VWENEDRKKKKSAGGIKESAASKGDEKGTSLLVTKSCDVRCKIIKRKERWRAQGEDGGAS